MSVGRIIFSQSPTQRKTTLVMYSSVV